MLCLTLPCVAQKNLFKETFKKGAIGEALGKNAGQQILRNARVVQGKIMLEGAMPKVPISADVEKYILKSIPVSDFQNLPILLYKPSVQQRSQTIITYIRVMDSFKQFKKEMDTFLYYQSKLNERRVIPSAEREAFSNKINKMNMQLAQLKNLISLEDPAYRAACEYMLYVASVINPMMKGMLDEHEFIRSDRKYVMEEFFMHTPKGNKDSMWQPFLPFSVRTAKTANRLPKGLKMAVLNDKISILEKMMFLHEKVFFPDWSIVTYDDTEDLLKAIQRGQHFDIILTDIVVPGGGGYYLTSTLRDKGYAGVIIALSAYSESESLGRRMFKKGFDGMLSMPLCFEEGKEWPLEIMKKLQNYFYYRDLNGWMR